MGDGAAERRHLGRFLVHVDELVVAGCLGELVDPFLADLNPGAGADLFADLFSDILRAHARLSFAWICARSMPYAGR